VSDFENTTSDTAAPVRLVGRLSTQYFLESARLYGGLLPGDALTTLIFLTIVSRNLAKVANDPRESLAYASIEEPAPDHKRTPVTVYAVAKDLGLSYETVRRHVKRLLDAGVCHRGGDGLIVPAEVTARPEFVRAGQRNYENLQRLVRALDASGTLSALI
jgi:DNA-binding transcriptional ArsR family regulator